MRRSIPLVIGLAAVAALSAVTAALVLGNRLAEPTVVPDPYEAGLHYDDAHAAAGGLAPAGERHAHDAASVGLRAPPACDLGRGPCAQRVGGTTVTLALGPRPLRAMQELSLTVEAAPPDGAGEGRGQASFSMPGMQMGENRSPLSPDGPGRWSGKGVLVRCPSGGRRWAAEVVLPPRAGKAPLRATFLLEVVE